MGHRILLHPLRIHPPHYRGEGKTPCRVSSPPACIIQCARSSPHFTRSQQATQTWRGNSPRTIDHLCRGKVRAETKQSISAGTTLRLDAGIVHAGHVGSAVGLHDTGSSRSCPRRSCCRSPRPPCWATLSIQTTIQTCVLKSWASFRPPTTAVAAAAVAAAAAAAVEARKPLHTQRTHVVCKKFHTTTIDGPNKPSACTSTIKNYHTHHNDTTRSSSAGARMQKYGPPGMVLQGANMYKLAFLTRSHSRPEMILVLREPCRLLDPKCLPHRGTGDVLAAPLSTFRGKSP